MYSELATLLEASRGDSEIIVCGFVDVRGFSVFSENVESVEAALYIKSVYLRLMNEYFADADFLKPTGDGLLVIWRVEQAATKAATEKALKRRLGTAVRISLKLISDFPTITKGDPMINFHDVVPQAVGIGLARGAACRLTAGDEVLDYSGGTLNLAARLMDLARPRGLVVDGSFGLELLPAVVQAKFTTHRVYIRSVAESEPRVIWTQVDAVTIPPTALRPLDRLTWKEVKKEYASLRELAALGPRFRIQLPSHPLVPSDAELRVTHPAYIGSRLKKGYSQFRKHSGRQWLTYEEEAGKPVMIVEYGKLAKDLRDSGHRPGWGPIVVRVVYAE